MNLLASIDEGCHYWDCYWDYNWDDYVLYFTGE
jgi:hypothetical protein